MTEENVGKERIVKEELHGISKVVRIEDHVRDENTHVFKKPFIFEGKEYTCLQLDLGGLTGEDIESAETEFTIASPQQSAQTPLKELSKPFLAYVAATAAGVPVELMRSLPAAEYAKITTRVQTFLLSGE